MVARKVYTDSEGYNCSLIQMIEREPEWALARIKEGERAVEANRKLIRIIEDNKLCTEDELKHGYW